MFTSSGWLISQVMHVTGSYLSHLLREAFPAAVISPTLDYRNMEHQHKLIADLDQAIIYDKLPLSQKDFT